MKKPNNKGITIFDLIPDMKRDIYKIQEEQSEIRFCGKTLDDNLDKLCKSMGIKFTQGRGEKIL